MLYLKLRDTTEVLRCCQTFLPIWEGLVDKIRCEWGHDYTGIIIIHYYTCLIRYLTLTNLSFKNNSFSLSLTWSLLSLTTWLLIADNFLYNGWLLASLYSTFFSAIFEIHIRPHFQNDTLQSGGRWGLKFVQKCTQSHCVLCHIIIHILSR